MEDAVATAKRLANVGMGDVLAKRGASAMLKIGGRISRACYVGLSGVSALILSVGPSWAGVPAVPAPLVGVTGPVGLLAAGAAYGGYLLFKHFQNRG